MLAILKVYFMSWIISRFILLAKSGHLKVIITKRLDWENQLLTKMFVESQYSPFDNLQVLEGHTRNAPSQENFYLILQKTGNDRFY